MQGCQAREVNASCTGFTARNAEADFQASYLIKSDPSRDYKWSGGFVGVDFIYSPRRIHSLLCNYAEAKDLNGTGAMYEGINMNTLSLAAS